ncbi:MAG: hypothetical protein VXX04_07695, partial [Actinomycetota bacterium]|nr:hypothetical protein [Actinomycetota bacterium]
MALVRSAFQNPWQYATAAPIRASVGAGLANRTVAIGGAAGAGIPLGNPHVPTDVRLEIGEAP